METKVGVVGALKKNQPGEYAVQQKSYVTTFEDVEVFTDLMLWESALRGVRGAKGVVVVGDGAVWIWQRIAPLLGKRIEILDWYHLSEKVWETAEGVYGTRTEAAARVWAEGVLERLWVGKVEKVLLSLAEQRGAAEQRGQSGEPALMGWRGLIHSLEENQGRMDYPRYRGMGLPIGSGVVEGACKAVVGGRMKQSGMQWRKAGGEAVLHLRAEFKSGRWDEDWHYLRMAA